MLTHVPLNRHEDGSLPSSAELERELARNPVCQGRVILVPPRWLLPPSRIPLSKTMSSVVWAFYDPDNTGFELMKRSPPCMFGRFVRVAVFESRAVLSQCSRCLRLGHEVSRCRKPRSTITCGLCGGPHTIASHPFHCPKAASKHKGNPCDCPTSCFLCIEKKMPGTGHSALSDSCPQRRLFRPTPPPTVTPPPPVISDPPSDAVTEPITPIAADTTMTLVSDLTPPHQTLLAGLRSSGADVATMAMALLPRDQAAGLYECLRDRGGPIPDALSRLFSPNA